jgi:hypothetical protein
MGQFKHIEQNHQHSQETLDILYGYDSFLDSLKVIADMGCGSGLDLNWWATLETRDDPPEPRNYLCYAVDKKDQVDPDVRALPNVIVLEKNFEERVIPRQVDLMWCHDAFQYIQNPLNTLRNWNAQMNVNGMLIIILKQNVTSEYNRLVTRGHNYNYFNHNLVNMVYMLAVNGFDCNDAYALKNNNDPWLHLAVYKSDQAPMDPATTSWHDLAERNLLNPSIIDSFTRHGHVRQEDIVYPWLDKDFYRVKT